ncbi:unnamed protein product [Orchesella dallaii]|uniref:Uncharacterized protein n=1 Tax=Orchesella dallaii TaxID=48710 RepID=A0ABP1PYT8_9HEXA
MAPVAKRSKRTTRTDDNPADEVSSSSETGSGSKMLCIVCGDSASKRIDKDTNYNAMLQLYWCSLGIDVKPEACQKAELCDPCFNKVVKYFETNDLIYFFENYFKSLRLEMLNATLKGVKKWEEKGKTLVKIQQDLRNKYGDIPEQTEAEQEAIKERIQAYKLDYQVENVASGEAKSKSRSTFKLSKPGSGKAKRDKISISLKEPQSPEKSDEDSE